MALARDVLDATLRRPGRRAHGQFGHMSREPTDIAAEAHTLLDALAYSTDPVGSSGRLAYIRAGPGPRWMLGNR